VRTLANLTHLASTSLAWSKLVGFSRGLFVVFSASSIQGTSSRNRPSKPSRKHFEEQRHTDAVKNLYVEFFFEKNKEKNVSVAQEHKGTESIRSLFSNALKKDSENFNEISVNFRSD
jgi:hypothetical protein